MKKYFYLGGGGVLGALARYGAGEGIGSLAPAGFPWGTMLINLSGCFILGLFLTLSQESRKLDPDLRIGIGTGFLGSYTTFSTFSVETLGLFEQGRWMAGGIYIASSVSLGILLAWLGVLAARALRSRGNKERAPGAED